MDVHHSFAFGSLELVAHVSNLLEGGHVRLLLELLLEAEEVTLGNRVSLHFPGNLGVDWAGIGVVVVVLADDAEAILHAVDVPGESILVLDSV